MATRADTVNTDEALTVEERASIAARAKFAEWHRAELEQRPRRILFFAITLGIVIALAIVFLFQGKP